MLTVRWKASAIGTTYNAQECVLNNESREQLLVPGHDVDRNSSSDRLAIGNQLGFSNDRVVLDVVECGLREPSEVVSNDIRTKLTLSFAFGTTPPTPCLISACYLSIYPESFL